MSSIVFGGDVDIPFRFPERARIRHRQEHLYTLFKAQELVDGRFHPSEEQLLNLDRYASLYFNTTFANLVEECKEMDGSNQQAGGKVHEQSTASDGPDVETGSRQSKEGNEPEQPGSPLPEDASGQSQPSSIPSEDGCQKENITRNGRGDLFLGHRVRAASGRLPFRQLDPRAGS